MSSSGIFSPDLQHCRFSKKIRTNWKLVSTEEFADRIIFVSMINDIVWTKKGNSTECLSNSEKVKNYAKKGFCLDIGHSSVQERKRIRHGTHKFTNLKDSGILLQVSWWEISKKVDIQYSGPPVR